MSENTNTEKKKWEDYTLAEKKESYLKLVIKEIAEAIKNDYAPFTKEAQNLPKAYNGSNGLPYTNLNSLMLDIKKNQHGYEDNVWISLNDARFLKADKEEINAIFNNKDIPKAQVSYIKTFEIEFVHKLDKNGKKIPLKDQDGNHLMSKNGEPLFEIAKEEKLDQNGFPIINPNTNQPDYKYVTKKNPIEPTLETRFLYNIKEFKTIDKSRIKPLNKDQEYKNFIRHSKDFDSSKSSLIFQDIEKYLRSHTAGQIATYLKAQNNNTSYTPPTGLNETEKIQVQRNTGAMIKKILEEEGLNQSEKKQISTQVKEESSKTPKQKNQVASDSNSNKKSKTQEQTESKKYKNRGR